MALGSCRSREQRSARAHARAKQRAGSIAFLAVLRLQCLEDGTLGAASLDVFANEPLSADSPFWTHPKVVLTPHNAADTDPEEISKYVAHQIERFEAGAALENVVDPARGY